MSEPVRRMSAPVLVGVCVMLALSIAFTWGILLPSRYLRPIARATGYLVQPTLITNAVTGVAVVIVSWPTLRDLGLARGLVRGLVVLVTGYAAIQVGLAIAARELVPGPALTAPAGAIIGSVVAQVVGTALVEESVFRGLLFRQLALRMHVALAGALAAFLFAVWHIPQRQSLGLSGLDLVGSIAVVWLGGVFAAWLYLRSENLYVVIALHALFNEGAPLVQSPVSHQVILAIYVMGLIAWIEWSRTRR
jgi:uncharacterized protein